MYYPWLLVGNLSLVLYATDKQSSSPKLASARDFQEALYHTRLLELRSCGVWFTWSNNKEGNDLVKEKLDKGMRKETWLSRYLDSSVYYLPLAASDHSLILIDTCKPQKIKNKK